MNRLSDYARLPYNWTIQLVHNGWGIANVVDLVWLRPLAGGLLAADHPFATGVDPQTGQPVWDSNLVFATEPDGSADESDAAIVRRVGGYMAGLVRRSAASQEGPVGKPSRMPPAIAYLHGGVHYNGVWLLFNDTAEAIAHFSDRRFRREFKRMVRTEDREPVVVFRRRDLPDSDYANFVCFMRTVLHWFSNSNGPRRVLWGNPSPYPAVNTITGRWIGDVRKLRTEPGRQMAARPPVSARYFADGPYAGRRRTPNSAERTLAELTNRRIAARGDRGNLFFIDKRRLDQGDRFVGRELRSRAELGRVA